MYLVTCSESLKQTFLVHFKVKSGDDGKQDFDDLELHLAVSLAHTVANRLNYCIDELPWQPTIHV